MRELWRAVAVGAVACTVLVTAAVADTILVPEQQTTIQACVDVAIAGDICSVAPGVYTELPTVPFPQPTDVEAHVRVDKAITIRSRELYQATLDGIDGQNAFFWVKAAARIEGFVIQDANQGILQRSSPNVEWEARNLILRNVQTGISINDRFTRIGSARVTNVVVSGCTTGFRTNDANAMDVRNTVVQNCDLGFEGSNHNNFSVDNTILHNVTVARDDPNHRGGELPVFGSAVFEADPSFVTVVTPTGIHPFALDCQSPAVDAGDVGPQFEDVSFPPSLGTFFNDIGAYGGPGANATLSDADALNWFAQAGCPVDEDEDGFLSDEDCDDTDSSTYPGAVELCDGKDNDCDGVLPSGELDNDDDLFRVCENDCDDSDAAINPDAVELPGNAVDENCDGSLGACDPTAAWRNHGQFVRCVVHEVQDLVANGLITEEQADDLITSAAQSDVGKR